MAENKSVLIYPRTIHTNVMPTTSENFSKGYIRGNIWVCVVSSGKTKICICIGDGIWETVATFDPDGLTTDMPTSIFIETNFDGQVRRQSPQVFISKLVSKLDESFLSRTQSSTPTVDNSFDLGSNSFKFKNMYATEFVGTSVRAKYADLAEKYTCKDTTLKVGTVVSVDICGIHEVIMCNEDCCAEVIGVVSDTPAYVMNTDSDGVIVGRVGKVPVRIFGPIRKGQIIVSAGNGCARAIENMNEKLDKIGVAFETNTNIKEKLVMCSIG